MKNRKIASRYVFGPNGKFLENTVLTFGVDGELLNIESVEPSIIDSMAGVEYYNGILIPGMTNGHCHLELSYLKGAVGQGGGLPQFIRDITSIRNDFTYEQQQDRAVVEHKKMWAQGVQAVGDISNGTASFKAKTSGNIYYYTFAEYFNMPPDSEADAYFADKTSHVKVGRELGLDISPSPHSTYLVSDKLFKKAAQSQRCSIHFMESRGEFGLFDKKGDMYDLIVESDMRPDFLGYGSHPERLINSLPSDMPLLLVHNTNCSLSDVEKVMNYFSDVTFVICPLSNYYIERAFPPAMMLWQAGARVAIGTDSLTSNHQLNMAAEIAWLSEHNVDLPFEVILQWATRGGALGLGKTELGRFEVGTKPGAVLLEGVDLRAMRPTKELSSRRIL